MSEKLLTFEEVDSHLEKHLPAKKMQAFTEAAPDLCNIYGIVKPVLTLVSQAFFIPQKWRDAVKVLISALDALCPGH
jgi:hypothetical protein